MHGYGSDRHLILSQRSGVDSFPGGFTLYSNTSILSSGTRRGWRMRRICYQENMTGRGSKIYEQVPNSSNDIETRVPMTAVDVLQQSVMMN